MASMEVLTNSMIFCYSAQANRRLVICTAYTGYLPVPHYHQDGTGVMYVHWYEKLAEYFPEHELKDKDHMRDLLDHHQAYRKWETDDFLVTYAEFPNFIFIDYFLVNPNTRGKGVGSKVLNAFKRRGKTIILEVEPPDTEGEDAERRIRFYEKNGFRKAEHIEYTRSDEDGTPYTMDVYYWAPNEVDEQTVLHKMATVCREIHNFRAFKHYGRLVADPEDVLNWVN
jgi:GNAT superfamily N-acetyltransferase